MKKSVLFVCLALLLLLSACGHQHSWTEASCTEPSRCSSCGVTTGGPLGHDWQPATCTEPEICSRCGETRGTALGHDPLPGDYWSEGLCSRCGAAVTPPLTPDFELYELDGRLVEQGESYDYKTGCYDDSSRFTTGSFHVTSYELSPGDGNELEIRDGYVWHLVRFEAVFSDENADKYGIGVSRCFTDYYDIRHFDATADYSDGGICRFEVLYKGQSYPCQMFYAGDYGEWENKSCVWSCDFSVQLPEGYDGMVLGLRNSGVDWPDDQYLFEIDNADSLFFRLKAD